MNYFLTLRIYRICHKVFVTRCLRWLLFACWHLSCSVVNEPLCSDVVLLQRMFLWRVIMCVAMRMYVCAGWVVSCQKFFTDVDLLMLCVSINSSLIIFIYFFFFYIILRLSTVSHLVVIMSCRVIHVVLTSLLCVTKFFIIHFFFFILWFDCCYHHVVILSFRSY
jgi:hypothetical protein